MRPYTFAHKPISATQKQEIMIPLTKVLCLASLGTALLLGSCQRTILSGDREALEPIEHINPYMGNISHLLVPTYPTVHLPNSMLRIYPNRADYTSEVIQGLPIIVTNHREKSAFSLSPVRSLTDSVAQVISYIYDREQITPYHYSVYLPEPAVGVEFAPAAQSAIYRLTFSPQDGPSSNSLLLTSHRGELRAESNTISGYQYISDSTKVYLYMEADRPPVRYGTRLPSGRISFDPKRAEGQTIALAFAEDREVVYLRYGVSFISEEQARSNVLREIQSYEIDMVAKAGRHEWTQTLGKIEIEGGTRKERNIFYTSLYRTYERMINISEDGHYYSGIDHKVHSDEGIPFYTDDWIWDTYLAVHPLRILIEAEKQQNMLSSYLRMAEQTPEGWLPTFPEVIGDTHRMNGNHVIASFADAYAKGLTNMDLARVYAAAKKTMAEKSFLPWTRIPKGPLSFYMDEYGYFPGLRPEQKETDPRVTSWEKRQSVAVSLAAYYDYWALSRLATYLGHDEEAKSYLRKSYDYRKIFNHKTSFFHPRDDEGKFIRPFDYERSGGMGVRDYYDENNAYTYRWDLKHNPADLINLMGGKEQFIANLNETFRTPLSTSKWEFYSQIPDQTGNVGQFSMGNEPSMHIPYLYNYAGAPWRTQRAVRRLIDMWFRDDLMGIPGDEDGGGLSAFVVFSMMGFYPVTPGLPIYNIGTPFFPKVRIALSSGRYFTITAQDVSAENKYIQRAELNGKPLHKPWFTHSDIADGGELRLEMGPLPNKKWGATLPPPSAESVDLP